MFVSEIIGLIAVVVGFYFCYAYLNKWLGPTYKHIFEAEDAEEPQKRK